MNLLVLLERELADGIPSNDRRAVHVRLVLRKGGGGDIKAAIADGPRGTARVRSDDGARMRFDFSPESPCPPPRPVELLLAAPRPIQAKRVLKDLASLGIARVLLCGSELGEKSYLESDFYRAGDFLPPLLEGSEQSGNPNLPGVTVDWTLARALTRLDARSERGRLAFDPRRAAGPFSRWLPPDPRPERFVAAIGSERGWTDRELDALDEAGFARWSLGDRVLKTETAAVAAVSAILARADLF